MTENGRKSLYAFANDLKSRIDLLERLKIVRSGYYGFHLHEQEIDRIIASLESEIPRLMQELELYPGSSKELNGLKEYYRGVAYGWEQAIEAGIPEEELGRLAKIQAHVRQFYRERLRSRENK